MGLMYNKQQGTAHQHALPPVLMLLGKDTIDLRTWERIFSIVSREADF